MCAKKKGTNDDVSERERDALSRKRLAISAKTATPTRKSTVPSLKFILTLIYNESLHVNL